MIIFGALITFLIQSSSILTATITPLVGEGFLTLEKAYPITLGANIGNTLMKFRTFINFWKKTGKFLKKFRKNSLLFILAKCITN